MLKYIVKYFNKNLSIGLCKKGGRNLSGKICVKGRGGGNKLVYRHIDFLRRINQFGIIIKKFYDRIRTATIGLIVYDNGVSSFTILSEESDSRVYSGEGTALSSSYAGWALKLANIKLFSKVNNIEMTIGKGAQLVRAAGGAGVLIGKAKNKAIIKLKSGWQIFVSENCMATVGKVYNLNHKFNKIGKAGKIRALGFKPKSRGIAKNPCDHPHGGGNGKKSAPTVPVNFTGRVKKWTPTTNKKIDILRRRLFKKEI